MNAPSNANTLGLAPNDALRLVPCPFCGGDVINTRSQEMTKGPAYYWHKCETCGAESEGDYGEDVAVAAWNRRADPASPLPGGGDWIDGTPEVPVGSPTWCGWASYEIRRLRSALPAAPTGEPK